MPDPKKKADFIEDEVGHSVYAKLSVIQRVRRAERILNPVPERGSNSVR